MILKCASGEGCTCIYCVLDREHARIDARMRGRKERIERERRQAEAETRLPSHRKPKATTAFSLWVQDTLHAAGLVETRAMQTRLGAVAVVAEGVMGALREEEVEGALERAEGVLRESVFWTHLLRNPAPGWSGAVPVLFVGRNPEMFSLI